MISRKLIRTDLNLLVALQILLEERNVTRAAERLSVSQPALSKTLQKLRDSFEDQLFTRTSHGLVPTPRAEELGRELPGLLETIEQVLGDAEFSPDTARTPATPTRRKTIWRVSQGRSAPGDACRAHPPANPQE